MKRGWTIAAVATASTLGATAAAQPPTGPGEPYYPPATAEYREAPQRGPLAAPSNAFELSLGTGYTQGFGSLQSGVGLPSVASAGIGFDLGLGYRVDPNWAVLWAGQYQELVAERTNAARGLTTSIAAQYHFAPMKQVDPWVELGAGYRFLWENPSIGPTLLTHGFQLARVRLGLDFRTEDMVAFGPMIGADANLFTFQDVQNLDATIDEPRISTFIFAGVQGRFDFGGRVRPGGAQVIGRR